MVLTVQSFQMDKDIFKKKSLLVWQHELFLFNLKVRAQTYRLILPANIEFSRIEETVFLRKTVILYPQDDLQTYSHGCTVYFYQYFHRNKDRLQVIIRHFCDLKTVQFYLRLELKFGRFIFKFTIQKVSDFSLSGNNDFRVGPTR